MRSCKITLIGTRHREIGQCTSNALLQIIEKIAPDVIFEEVPPSKFDALYSGLLQDSLESKTIKRYLEKKNTTHVPVDAELDEITDRFSKSDFNVMVNIFGNHSDEYKDLYYQQHFFAEKKGFGYLNSNDWSLLSKRLEIIEKQLIKEFDNYKLTQRYNEWLNILDIRNAEMIRNIYKYVDTNNCENGLFLVGVEHRRQIMEMIPEFESKHDSKLNWNFDYFNQ